ncbi:MAG: sporadic carbohydrate cluster protein, TIGR04323 family [Deltaproteobacteria bacterium]|nr:sporadic carbohydrate cluster protein, TIGR04323 family [Deltaproteobacteria bacterium]
MTETEASRGFRGYIGSRPLGDDDGHRVPQHVQNLVIRDYASRHGLTYRLSAVEYAMPGCFLMLEQVLSELEDSQGIIAYSLFMLPRSATRRARIWQRLLETGSSLHAAIEEQVLAGPSDIERLETLFQVNSALAHAWRPMAPSEGL